MTKSDKYDITDEIEAFVRRGSEVTHFKNDEIYLKCVRS